MNTEDRFYGLTRTQWALIADLALQRGRELPDPKDLLAADELLVWWMTETGDHDPTPNVILGVDILGRELPPRKPEPRAVSYSLRVMAAAAVQALYPLRRVA